MFERTQRFDPNAELIAELRGQVAYLKEQNAELQKQLLAMADAAAFRMTHPREEEPGEPVMVEDVRSPFKPSYTLGEIKGGFTS